jgi:hypothetical protein
LVLVERRLQVQILQIKAVQGLPLFLVPLLLPVEVEVEVEVLLGQTEMV